MRWLQDVPPVPAMAVGAKLKLPEEWLPVTTPENDPFLSH
jgi:hypothetical protein